MRLASNGTESGLQARFTTFFKDWIQEKIPFPLFFGFG